MSRARPGFRAAFGPSFARAFRGALPWKKMLLLTLALAVAPALAAIVGGHPPARRGNALVALVVFLYLQLLVPLTGLLFGTAVIQAEEGAGNLPYLLTRPAPRSALVLGRGSACLALGWLALGASLGVTFLLMSGAEAPADFRLRAALAVLAAYPAYLAAFALLSGFTRFAIVAGFFYAFGVEGALGLIPGMIRKATLLFYSRSLLGEWSGRPASAADLFGAAGPATTTRALAVLVGTTAIAVLLSVRILSRRQYAGRNPGRA